MSQLTQTYPRPPYVNREDELLRLREASRALGHPDGHAALVALRRMGKSMLATAFSEELRQSGWLVAEVEADDAANSPSVWLLHVVRALIRAVRPETVVEPNATSIRVAAIGMQMPLPAEIEGLLALTEKKRPSTYELFSAPLRFCQRVSTVLGRPVLVVMDEFPSVLGFERYPDLRNLRGTLRAIAEKESPSVMFLIAGSAVHKMRELLEGDSPLLTRVREVTVGRFTEEASRELISRLLDPAKTVICADAVEATCDYSGNHPFYVDRLVRKAFALMKRERRSELQRADVD